MESRKHNGYQSRSDAVRVAVRNAPLRYRLFLRTPEGGGYLEVSL